MWALVTPSARQCGPPELLATLPPIEHVCWLLGSGAKCTPRWAICFDRSRFSTPGSTHACRFSASTEMIRFIFDGRDHDRAVGWHGPAGQPGAGAAGEERHAEAGGDRDRRLHVGSRLGEHDDAGRARSCSRRRVGTGVSRLLPTGPGRIDAFAERADDLVVIAPRSLRTHHDDATGFDLDAIDEDLVAGCDVLGQGHEPAVALGLQLVLVLVHRLAALADGVDDVRRRLLGAVGRPSGRRRRATPARPSP